MIREDDQNLVKRLEKIDRELSELKTEQPYTGDSWLPYKYAGQFTVPAGSYAYLSFTQDYPEVNAVVKVNQALDFSIYSVGRNPKNGVWVWVARNDGFTDIIKEYTISSTQTGAVNDYLEPEAIP